MLNRVSNIFADSDQPSGSAALRWRVDGNPNIRLVWLGAAVILPLLAILPRLVQVQSALRASIVDRYQQTTETVETIPSKDGRILSSDGRVLAYDVERYDIHAHYRWVEQPADKDWLRHRALSQLSRSARRIRQRVIAEEESVLEQRDAAWNRLAQLADVPNDDLQAERQRIQHRVERIIDRVERRRERTDSEEPETTTTDDPEADDGWWQSVGSALVTTLTTAPRRRATDPIVIQEELQYHPLLEDVHREVAAEVAAHPELFPGLRVRISTRRVYPAHDVAAHLIGNRLPIGDDELKSRQERFADGDPLDYLAGDRIGKTGVERSYDRYLRGLRGERRITTNRRGEVIDTQIVRPPHVGRDVVLTLHLPLQERLEYILDEAIRPPSESAGSESGTRAPSDRGGVIVAIDVHTGEVLAAASAPRFDLNLLVSPTPERWREAMSDPGRPFFSRPTQMTLPPGSVFKALTAIALMESGRFDPDEKVFCQGFLDNPNRFRCYIYRNGGRGHAEMDLTDAITQSCNVYFFNAARQVGPEPIIDWARRFGFGQPTGIDLPGERGGNLPTPPDMRVVSSRVNNNATQHLWYPGDTLGLAIGQSRLTVTPMQVARMMAAVANGGYLVTPHVVRDFGPSFGDAESSEFPSATQPQRIAGLTEASLARVREGLEKVVAHPRGTGYKRVRLSQITIAGKTGTAETGGTKGDHAWFAGYVPAREPRIAFVVVLEHAGSGGRVAGPVARQLVEAMLELGVLQPTRTAMR
jgi:penicillin-binding protein 2